MRWLPLLAGTVAGNAMGLLLNLAAGGPLGLRWVQVAGICGGAMGVGCVLWLQKDGRGR